MPPFIFIQQTHYVEGGKDLGVAIRNPLKYKGNQGMHLRNVPLVRATEHL